MQQQLDVRAQQVVLVAVGRAGFGHHLLEELRQKRALRGRELAYGIDAELKQRRLLQGRRVAWSVQKLGREQAEKPRERHLRLARVRRQRVVEHQRRGLQQQRVAGIAQVRGAAGVEADLVEVAAVEGHVLLTGCGLNRVDVEGRRRLRRVSREVSAMEIGAGLAGNHGGKRKEGAKSVTRPDFPRKKLPRR